jgi:hypothetical protein
VEPVRSCSYAARPDEDHPPLLHKQLHDEASTQLVERSCSADVLLQPLTERGGATVPQSSREMEILGGEWRNCWR